MTTLQYVRVNGCIHAHLLPTFFLASFQICRNALPKHGYLPPEKILFKCEKGLKNRDPGTSESYTCAEVPNRDTFINPEIEMFTSSQIATPELPRNRKKWFDSNNSNCECSSLDEVGTVYCEYSCDAHYNRDILCNCEGLMRGSNKSTICQGRLSYFTQVLKDVFLKLPSDLPKCVS